MFNFRAIAKRTMYALHPPSWPKDPEFDIGFIFHTEQIYRKEFFLRLVRFTKHYKGITGVAPIICLMTPKNPLVVEGMKRENVSESEFKGRVLELATLASIGYHGHFFFDTKRPNLLESEMRGHYYDAVRLKDQVNSEITWFQDAGVKLSPFYSAGWWFFSEAVVAELMRHGFRYDFSFSPSVWFQHVRSWNSFRFLNQIPVGQPIEVSASIGKMRFIPNLIGCHTTPYVEDYVRNVRRLIGPGLPKIIYSHHSHDFDLDEKNTVMCLEFLAQQDNVKFFGGENIDERISAADLNKITWKEGHDFF